MATTDIAALLGSALRKIRKQTSKTQDGWSERTGMSQSYTSAAERGVSGWESVKNIAEKVEAAGGDPLDLLRLAVAELEMPADQQELLALWGTVDARQREAILTLLRAQTRARTAAR